MAAKQIIFSTIKAAQEKEDQNQEQEAFQSYLHAVQQLVSQLQRVSPQDPAPICGIPTSKLFVLASNCLESAQSLFDRASTEQRDFRSAQVVVPPPHTTTTTTGPSSLSHSVPAISQKSPSHPPHSHPLQPNRIMSEVTVGSTTLIPPVPRHHSVSDPHPPFRRRPQVVRKPVPHQQQYSVQPLHRLSPMDGAKKKNMYLMQQYKASLRRDSLRMLGESRQNMTLNYLRRMEENRSVARINEQNIARKAKEREARLKQENQRVRMTHFKKPMEALTPEELSQEVAAFDQGKKDIISAKQKLSASPNSANLANNLVNEILSFADHPLCKLLVEYQFGVMQFLQPLAKKIESGGKLPNMTVTTDRTGDPLCAVPCENTLSCDSNHTSSPATGRSPTDHTHDVTDGSESCLSKVSDSLDLKLEALRAELIGGGGGDRKEEEELKSPDSVFNGAEGDKDIRSGSVEDTIKDEDDFTTLSSTSDYQEERFATNGGGPSSEEEEDEFSTMREANFDESSDAQLTQSDQGGQEEQTVVVFKGLRPVTCTPYFGNFTRMSKECSEYLNGTIKLLHSAVDKLVHSFTLIYPNLAIQDNIDECRNVVESNFFPALTPLLLPVYRCVNYKAECTVLKNMVEHCNDTPKEVGVRRKFWLENQDSAPYSNAIDTLHQLCSLSTPLAKLECLVTFSKSIIQSIEEYYSTIDPEAKDKVDTGVGVDDILPIMTYIIIRSARPQLISECSFMQEFIQECYSMGEEGFCLTSFDTAVRFVSLMNS